MTTRQVANTDLQSHIYWVGTTRIDTMEASHLLNSLRFLVKHPISQILQCSLRNDWIVAEASEHGSVDPDLPDGAQEIVVEIYRSFRVARAIKDLQSLFDDASERTADEVARDLGATLPTPTNELTERARDWITETPTWHAMANRLVELLVEHGDLHQLERMTHETADVVAATDLITYEEPF